METITIPQFSNPRREAMIDDWPIGRQRCRCWFQVERTNRGERVARRTENKTRTGWNQPKRTTYGDRCAIVDGDDGRTWLLSYRNGAVCVWISDMQHTLCHVYADDPLFAGLMALIGGAK